MSASLGKSGVILSYDDEHWSTWSDAGIPFDAIPKLAQLVLKDPLAGYTTFDAVCNGPDLDIATLEPDTLLDIVYFVSLHADQFYLVKNEGGKSRWRINIYRSMPV